MTEIPAVLPSKARLEREQAYLLNEKLKIETDKIRREAQPEKWWSRAAKKFVVLGGAVTVGATIFGIWDSYNKTIIDRERTRITDQRTRFEDAIKRLESSNTISKLVGVSILNGYLNADSKDLHRQVLFTFASLMATESDVQTQTAVIDLIGAIPAKGVIAPAEWSYFQDILVSQSRALMLKGNILADRYERDSIPEERAAQTVAKLIAVNIRNGAVPDYRNYRGIYCVKCDFRGAHFSSGADFSGAILDDANFNGAVLQSTIFDNADLLGSTFVEADLRGAKFRSLDAQFSDRVHGNGILGRTSYIDRIAKSLDRKATIRIAMPKFNCANLEDTNFDGHALLPAIFRLRRKYELPEPNMPPSWYPSVPQFVKDRAKESGKPAEFNLVTVVPPLFYKANLKNAKLDKIEFFTISERDDVTNGLSSSRGITVGNFISWQGSIDEDALEAKPQPEAAESADAGKPADERQLLRKRAFAGEQETLRMKLRAPFFRRILYRQLCRRNCWLI